MAISQIGVIEKSSSGNFISVGPISQTNVSYGVAVDISAGTWAISAIPATQGIIVRLYDYSGNLLDQQVTAADGSASVSLSSDASSIWAEKRVTAVGEDGASSAISPSANLELSYRGPSLQETSLASFEIITSSGVTPSRAGTATIVLVGGGMNGQASAGGTSVGSGGRTGHVNVVKFAKLNGSEISTVSSSIAFGSSNTAGETKLGNYTSLSGAFVPAANYGMNVTPNWELHKAYAYPAISGSTGSGRGGYNGNDWPSGTYRIGKGGNCGAGVTQNAVGYGSGGGGGFWNGQPGGPGAPGIIYIAWLD